MKIHVRKRKFKQSLTTVKIALVKINKKQIKSVKSSSCCDYNLTPVPRIYHGKYIEDIYFFEVNTKYISSSELKTSKFSRVRSTSEN